MIVNTLLEPLEGALNRRIESSTPAVELRERMAGNGLAIEFDGLPLTLYFRVAEGKLVVHGDYRDDPDAVLRGAPLALLRMADPAAASVGAGGVNVTGDTQVAQNFQKLLRLARPDWEEELSRVIGDVGAHQVGNALRGFMSWATTAASKLSRDTAEFLQEESRDLPTRSEVEIFLDGVDDVRAQVDRFEARLQRLPGG